MIFNQVLGNIDDINDLNNLHIEKIYINSENIQEQNKDDELKGWGVIS